MAIQGSLREASLPDVLQLLALGQKTGCLSVTDRSEFGHVYLRQGSICYASIVNRRDRLGDLLVKNGLVPPAVLQEAVEAQSARDGKRLGQILVERGAISQAQLEQYIRLQIEEAVYYLFTWTQGSFTFESGQEPEPGAMQVAINPENLLLEGARRVDEWSQIEKKIPSLDLIFRVEADPGVLDGAELTAEQNRILPLVDGRRSVQEIIDEAGLVEFEVGKALFGLIQAGFAHPVGRRAPSATPGSVEARLQELRNLGVAFYRAGMLDEGVREFHRMLELRSSHPDAHFFLGLIGLRRGSDRLALRHFKALVEAGARWASAFHGLALVLERMDRLDDALVAAEEALRMRPRHPATLLSHGVLLAKTGRMPDAAEALRRYRAALAESDASASPAASYFAFAVLAEAAQGQGRQALDLADEGLRAHPDSAPLLLHAGVVRERAGEAAEAEALYRRAVEVDPALAPAHKALADALLGRGAEDEAALAYRRALDLDPGRGDDAYARLGEIRLRGGGRAEAVDLWREALRRNPANETARRGLEGLRTAEGAGGR